MAHETDGGRLLTSDAGAVAPYANACTRLLDDVKSVFADAGKLVDCHDESGGAKVADSLMNVRGLLIDNYGTSMSPCVEARCDATYAYVASNSLPHYDFVQLTASALVEVPSIARIRLAPKPLSQQSGADDAAALDGCKTAYDQFRVAPKTATAQEPSNLCAQGAASYFYDTLATNRADYQRIPCLEAAGLMTSGVPLLGPNGAASPSPWGTPAYGYPNDLVSDGWGGYDLLDLCGGHSAETMHYHAAKYECFEQDYARRPLRSYSDATFDFNLDAALNDGCTKPSGIVGWSPDGYPIKGPCVCVERDAQGACIVVRKARSSWTYDGLAEWGNDPNELDSFYKEGKACTADTDCCNGGQDCAYSCSFTVVDRASSPGGTAAEKRCVLLDYSWCVHRLHARANPTPDAVSFAYLDRCNGFDGPDGYAYHTTLSFPYSLGCYRGEVGPTNGWFWQGMPFCAPGQASMCCGNGTCEARESNTSCPADC